MKELNIMPIINPEEENNNEKEKEDYNYLNNDVSLITNEKNKNNIDFNEVIKVKDFKYYKNCIKSFFKSFTVFAFIYLFYLFSLEGCFKGDDICGNNMKWIYTKLTQIIISSEIIVYLIVRILFYKSPKIHLIHLVIVFLLFYQYSHNYYFYDH